MIAIYIYIFIFGLVLGYFVNLLIYRIQEDKSIITPPSACPVSGRRLLVQLLTAAAVTGLFARFGTSFAFFAFIYLILILTAVFFIDIDHRIIPDELVLAGLAGGAAVFVYNIFFPEQMSFGDGKWWTPLAGVLSGSGILILVAIVGILIYKTDDAMGMGDVKLLAPIGMFLGWKLCMAALFISIILAGAFSLILIVLRLKKKKDTIPFGPFIVIGTYLVIIFGWSIINWYTGTL